MFEKPEIPEAPGGGFNFGVINKKSNALDDIKPNTPITKLVIPVTQFVYKEESGFGVYECDDEEGNPLKITGTFMNGPLTIGQTYEVTGKVSIYQGEKQIQIETARITRPVNQRGIVSYLKTLKGLDAKAELIYEIFGDESIDVLLADPLRVAKEVKGIGKKSVMSWQEQLAKLKDDQQTITQLFSYGLTVRQVKKLYDTYKEGILYKIEENPYFLASELDNFGFEKCDAIAKDMGYDPKGMFRIQEGIMHILKESSFEGHCYLPVIELIKRCKDLLDIKFTAIQMNKLIQQYRGQASFDFQFGQFNYRVNYQELANALYRYNNEPNRLKKESKRYVLIAIGQKEIVAEISNLAGANKIIFEDDDKVYLPSIYEAETKVAERVFSLVKSETNEFDDVEKDLDDLLNTRSITLEAKQREAVLTFAKGRGGFFILNGSAGCGKTFTLNIILEILEMQYKKEFFPFNVQVFAPTGKASKVASKATGRNCMTVHRGLKYKPNLGFEHNENNPLDGECIVVDESSMLDILLTRSLLSAISDGTKVIFLGDTKQLPSVGPGNILHDLIKSEVVKVVTLNVVKRQGEQSGIIRNANHIINNEMISSCKDTNDAFVVRKESPVEVQQAIIRWIQDIRVKKGYSLEDIQVLCPQKTSQIGTTVMNYLIQQAFNPDDGGLKILNKRLTIQNPLTGNEEKVNLYFRKGDKVIHMKNNYNMTWYRKGQYYDYAEDLETVGITNGETGVIEDILKEEHFDSFKTRIVVRYEDKYVFYDDDFSELEHSFALTTHKSQGSQWKSVILPIMNLNFMMLDNNLFYTGYTRAQQFCVVIGQKEAIEHAIRTHKIRDRYTGLLEKLRRAC